VAAAYTLTAAPDGRPVRIRGLVLCRVVGGRITRRTDYWDSLTFLRETGRA
jgi:ketosteroid isomerase-like protein